MVIFVVGVVVEVCRGKAVVWGVGMVIAGATGLASGGKLGRLLVTAKV
jgi:hypothetical protein